MQTHLSRNQRRGTAIFLGLCLLCLAAAIWKNSFAPAPSPDPYAEAGLRRQLNSLQPVRDTLPANHAAPASVSAPRRKSAGTKSRPDYVPATPVRSPLDEQIISE